MAKRSSRSQAPKTSSTSMVTVMFLLVAGSGGLYFLKSAYERNRIEDEEQEAEYEDRRRREMRAQILEAKHREGKEKLMASPEIKQEISFERAISKIESLLDAEAYSAAMQAVELIASKDLTPEQRLKVERFQKLIPIKVQHLFDELVATAKEREQEGDYEGAINAMEEAVEMEFPAITSQAKALIARFNKMKNLGTLGSQLIAFAEIQKQLGTQLMELDYVAAAGTAERMAREVDYTHFKDDLLGIKGDFEFVEKAWIGFVRHMSRRIGEEEMFGIEKGKVTGIKEGAIVLKTDDEELLLTLKDIQPKWIQRRTRFTKEQAADEYYGIGVLYLHKGRHSEATAIFNHFVGENDRVERHFNWIAWNRELEAMNTYESYVAAAERKDVPNVRKLSAELQNTYGGTRFYASEEANVERVLKEIESYVEQQRAAAMAIVARLEQFETSARSTLQKWYEEKQRAVEAQYQRELRDDYNFIKGRDYLYTKRLETGNMKKNIAVVLASVKQIRDGDYDVSSEIRRRIEHDKNYLEKGVIRADANHVSNAKLLKRKFIKLGDAIKDARMRIERKLKAGEVVDDEEIREKLNVID